MVVKGVVGAAVRGGLVVIGGFLECFHGGYMVAMWMCWWLTRWLRVGGEVSLGFGGKRR